MIVLVDRRTASASLPVRIFSATISKRILVAYHETQIEGQTKPCTNKHDITPKNVSVSKMPYLIRNIHVSRPLVDGRNSYSRGEASVGSGTARGGGRGTSTEQRWLRHTSGRSDAEQRARMVNCIV